MENEMFQDLRFAARILLKHKSFTAVAALTLALGIGANTAIFSVINAVLLRSLPFKEADRLVVIYQTHPEMPRIGPSFLDYQDWLSQAQSFQEMAVHADRLRNAMLTGVNETVYVQGTMVSPNLFPLLGINPALGRTFLPDDEKPENNQVVILSHALWQRSFAGDPNIIGKAIRLRDKSFTVIGVMGEQYPLEKDLWLPLSQLNADVFTDRMNHEITSVIGRLKPAVTIEQASREMETIAARLQQLYPASNKSFGVVLLPLRHQLVGDLRPVVLLIFAAVGLIMLIACANVSNLLLAKSAARRRELAVRAALGAGRGRLVRQLLSESLLLSLLGGAAGLALALMSLSFVRSSLSSIVKVKVPGLDAVGIDWFTLAFTFGVTLLAGLLFGIAPALQSSRIQLNQSLKTGGISSVSGGRRNLSRALVVIEVALAIIVMIGAGLLIRSFQKLLQVDPGFRTDNLLSLSVNLPLPRYQRGEQVRMFYNQLIPRLQSLPGVEQVALTDWVPFASGRTVAGFVPEGVQPEPGKQRLARLKSADPRAFEILGIPLRSGRLFDEKDTAGNPFNRVVVNETMARQFAQDPIGKHLQMHWGGMLEIIGVVADTKDLRLEAPVEPEIYWPGVGPNAVLLVRTKVDPLSLAAVIRQTVLSLEPAQPAHQAKSVDEILHASLARRRFTTSLLSVFGFSALALAAIGIYGVVGYSVTERTREIGIRMALGAQRGDVLKLVIGRGIVPALLGVVIGMAGAFALSRLMASLTSDLLFEVRAGDPVTFAAIALLLLIVALLACFLPARRATKVDPLVSLRHE
jgi:putative ABC transport system permease protein